MWYGWEVEKGCGYITLLPVVTSSSGFTGQPYLFLALWSLAVFFVFFFLINSLSLSFLMCQVGKKREPAF